MEELIGILSAGGDLSTMALVYIAWRFDKRLSHLEALEEFRAAHKSAQKLPSNSVT